MKWGVRKEHRRDVKFRKKNPELARKLEEDYEDAISTAKRSISIAYKNLKRYKDIDSHDYTKEARKEINEIKSYLKESYKMGDGGIKNPTDKDAINDYFMYVRKDLQKKNPTINDVADSIKNGEKNSVKKLTELENRVISQGNKYIYKLSNMSLRDLNKNRHNLYNQDKIINS